MSLVKAFWWLSWLARLHTGNIWVITHTYIPKLKKHFVHDFVLCITTLSWNSIRSDLSGKIQLSVTPFWLCCDGGWHHGKFESCHFDNGWENPNKFCSQLVSQPNDQHDWHYRFVQNHSLSLSASQNWPCNSKHGITLGNGCTTAVVCLQRTGISLSARLVCCTISPGILKCLPNQRWDHKMGGGGRCYNRCIYPTCMPFS